MTLPLPQPAGRPPRAGFGLVLDDHAPAVQRVLYGERELLGHNWGSGSARRPARHNRLELLPSI
jgi:hypothetical protein